MNVELTPLSLPGTYQIQCKVFEDPRGLFIKTFQQSRFEKLGLEASFVEEFHTVSKKNVLRGLHFQLPPHDHVKIISCLVGEILDVVVDLRKGSPTYGQHELLRLSGEEGKSIYIPKGMAHGFYVLSEKAIVSYQHSREHAPEADSGVRWDSAGIPWPCDRPLVSTRDAGLVRLEEFVSPFIFKPMIAVAEDLGRKPLSPGVNTAGIGLSID